MEICCWKGSQDNNNCECYLELCITYMLVLLFDISIQDKAIQIGKRGIASNFVSSMIAWNWSWRRNNAGMGGLFGLVITHAMLAVCSDMPTNHYATMLIIQISQSDVDMFWKDSKLPCCQVKVIAQDTSKTSLYLHYPVPVKDIRPEKTVFILCSLTETNHPCELWDRAG